MEKYTHRSASSVSVIVEIVEAGTVYTIQRCIKCREYHCKKWIKATNLVTNLVRCLCHGKLNHKIAGQASAASYYPIQFQQMAGCISMYTSMQTSWFLRSLQHCWHCMPSVDVTAQARFFAKETQCHVSWCAVVSHPVIQSWQLQPRHWWHLIYSGTSHLHKVWKADRIDCEWCFVRSLSLTFPLETIHREYYCKKWIKATTLVTILVGCLCHGKMNHIIASQASAAIYYPIQFQQMAGCVSVYTSMQTSCFQMSPALPALHAFSGCDSTRKVELKRQKRVRIK